MRNLAPVLLCLTLAACGSAGPNPPEPPANPSGVEASFHRESDWRFRDSVTVAETDRVEPPVVLTRVKAEYAVEPRKQRLQGDVGLELEVDERGTVVRAVVTQPLEPALDANAIVAATQWRYSPARVNGVPRASLVKATVSYRLQ